MPANMLLRTGIELADDEVSGGAHGVLHLLCVGVRDGDHQESCSQLAVSARLLVTLLISCWSEYYFSWRPVHVLIH